MSDSGKSTLNLRRLPEVSVRSEKELSEVFSARHPVVIRGLASEWPLVKAGMDSGAAARRYLIERHVDRPFVVSVGPPGMGGRLFYQDDMSMNFETFRARLPEIFERIETSEADADQPIVYLGSVDAKAFFDGVHEENRIDLGDRDPLVSIWIGLRTRIAAHQDFPDNLACVAVGRRRFTLFPPCQFRNLYLGPVDNTPAGRAISMVDISAPDFGKFPRFRDALAKAQVAELSAGDAIFIPSMWWHHVEGLDPFNVLINYWWRDTPRHMGQPQDALYHAMMSIRDLPDEEKQHWRELFDYYVFENTHETVAHIPEAARSILGPMTPERSNRIRAFLLRALNQ